ncbi:MAG TPA: diadenylate cyclase [Chitinispirillaceae bacterium]|nr:diadenylate cyclase [Chitinispirillaceae bacterium]
MINNIVSFLRNAFLYFRLADLVDITVISVILYFVLIWIKQRASRSAIIALVSVVVLYSGAHIFSMYLTSMLFKAGLTAALVALVLIFQEDLRMAIEQLSSWRAFNSKHALVASAKTIESLVESSVNLARDRIGALIVIKGRDSLERHLSGGFSLNGRLSMPLLYSIFHPATPSHDGAVIIEADRIDRFGVRLPLSHNNAEVGNAGTRHTAALGLSERSDALVIVVSEERGVVSIAENGRLNQVSSQTLQERLDSFYRNIFPEPKVKKRFTWLTSNMPVKIASVSFAVLFWLALAFKVETVNRIFTVPVECRNLPKYMVVENQYPTEVQISVSGIERAFNFDPTSLVVSFDMSSVADGEKSIKIERDNINLPEGIKIQKINPHTITFVSKRFAPVDVPVRCRLSGNIKHGYKLIETKVQPSTIKLLVPTARLKSKFEEVYTEPLRLEQLTDNSTTMRLKLVLPYGVKFLNENDNEVRVVANIGKED